MTAFREAQAVVEGVPCTTLAQQQEIANALLLALAREATLRESVTAYIHLLDTEGMAADDEIRALLASSTVPATTSSRLTVCTFDDPERPCGCPPHGQCEAERTTP